MAMCSSMPDADKDMGEGMGNDNECRVVCIGKTGSGKSALCNTVVGEIFFKSEVSWGSVTKECSYKTAKRFGKKLKVVDTPGLCDTEMTNENMAKEIVKCVAISFPGPHGIVMVIPISRFTKEDIDTLQLFSSIFGEEMYNHLIVVFTRKDELDGQYNDIHDFIKRKAPESLRTLVEKCNGRILAINNRQEPNMKEKDAEKLINMVDDVVKKNGGRYYSNEMYEEAEKRFNQRIQDTERQKEEEKEKAIRKIKDEAGLEYKNKLESVEKQIHETERKYFETLAQQRIQSQPETFETKNNGFGFNINTALYVGDLAMRMLELYRYNKGGSKKKLPCRPKHRI